jgi:hypothetical protein
LAAFHGSKGNRRLKSESNRNEWSLDRATMFDAIRLAVPKRRRRQRAPSGRTKLMCPTARTLAISQRNINKLCAPAPSVSGERPPTGCPLLVLNLGMSANYPHLSLAVHSCSDSNYHERFHSRPEVSQVAAFPSQIRG